MKLLKKLLRGIFYFCVGVKASFGDFLNWYLSSGAPRFMRNKLSLGVMAVAIVAGGWGLFAMLGNMDSLERREMPVAARSQAQPQPSSEAGASSEEGQAQLGDSQVSSSGDAASSPSGAERVDALPPVSSSDGDPVGRMTSSAKKPEADVLASATRFQPFSAEQLNTALAERTNAYYQQASFKTPARGDIAGWKEINPDVVGWISISNTNIDYPVVIGAYTDYYTSRGYYKEASYNGVIWFDSDTRFDAKGNITSTNAVLYGHNWTNYLRPARIGNASDVMFGQLAAYDHADFAANNPYVKIKTAAGESTYQVFTVFYTDLSFGYNYAEKEGNGMMDIINTAKEKSIHKFDVPVTAKDKIITLSTCTRVMGPGDNQRFVVMAKKIK